MSYLYVGQSALRVLLTCNTSLASITSAVIKAQNPSGTITSWTATVSGPTAGTIYYDLTTALTGSGQWKFWSYITFSDGRIGIGDAITQVVKAEGK